VHLDYRTLVRLAVRDRSCRFPGCDRPPTWCDAHHIKHWLHLGRTDLENLILLCRRHHTLVHQRGFRISCTAAHPTFHRPDRTALGRDGPG
jgi:HNH endonuclease